MFGIIWDLKMFGLVSSATDELVNLCCDFSAKVSRLAWCSPCALVVFAAAPVEHTVICGVGSIFYRRYRR
jgi:hypothetical protein